VSKIIELTNQNFEKQVLQSNIPILVDFWAPWCQLCALMSRILDELIEELDGKMKIGKVNTDTKENQQLAMQYQIQSIPNMKLFKNGQVIEEFIGLQDKEVLKKELEKKL